MQQNEIGQFKILESAIANYKELQEQDKNTKKIQNLDNDKKPLENIIKQILDLILYGYSLYDAFIKAKNEEFDILKKNLETSDKFSNSISPLKTKILMTEFNESYIQSMLIYIEQFIENSIQFEDNPILKISIILSAQKNFDFFHNYSKQGKCDFCQLNGPLLIACYSGHALCRYCSIGQVLL